MASGLHVDIGVTLARMERELAKVVKMSSSAAQQSENRFKQSNRNWVNDTRSSAQQIQQIITKATSLDRKNGSQQSLFDVQGLAANLDAAERKFNPVLDALTRYRTGLRELNLAHSAGAVSTSDHANATLKLKAAFDAEMAAMRKTNAELEKQYGIRSKIEANMGITNGPNANRGDDIRAYGQELDALRSKFDPVFAASKRYETQLEELNTAQRVGAITARQHEQALDMLNAEYAQMATNGAAGANAIQGTVKPVKASGFAVANLSAQLNDIGVSLAGGQSPFQVMIQQGTQVSQIFQQTGSNAKGFFQLLKSSVAGVLNPFSIATFAIIGLGGALLQYFTKADDGSKKAKDAIEELRSTLDAYVSASERAAQSSADLAKEYGTTAEEARKLAKEQKAFGEVKAIAAIEAAVQKVTQSYRDYRDEVKSAARRGGVSLFENEPIENFAASLGVTEEAAAGLGEKMRELDAQTSVADTIPIIREMKDLLAAAGANTATASDEARKLYGDYLDLEQSALKMVSEATGLAPELAAAAEAAKVLTDEMRNSVEQANELASKAQGEAMVAELTLKYRNDPDALEKAKAELDFDASVALPNSGVDSTITNAINMRREATLAAMEATRRDQAAIEEWKAVQNGAGDAVNAFVAASVAANQTTAELVEKYGAGATQARELLVANEELAGSLALAQLGAVVDDLAFKYEAWKNQLGLTVEEQHNLAVAVAEMRGAETFEEVATATAKVNGLLADAASRTGEATDQAVELRQRLFGASDAASQAAASASSITGELVNATAQADALAASMHTAANAAASAGQAARQAAADAKLMNDLRDDPIALSKAKAGNSFDRSVGDTSGFDPILQQGIQNQRDAVVGLAEDTERSRQALADWQEQQRKEAADSRKSGRSRATGANKAAKDSARRANNYQKDENSVEADIKMLDARYQALSNINPLLNDYGRQLDYAETRQKLLSEAEKEGLTLSPARVAAIDTLAQRHAEATAKVNELTAAQQRNKAAMEGIKSASTDILKGFISDLKDGKDAGDALADALDKISDKLLDSAFDSFGKGGGGGIGGFISSLFGGGSSKSAASLFSAGIGGLFDKGGYTGNIPKTDIAGAVHGREYVFDAETTQRIGVRNLEAMRKGYSTGGVTSGLSAQSGFGAMSGDSGGDHITVTADFTVNNGNLVPLITNVSGMVAGKQLKVADEKFGKRAQQNNVRGV